MTVELHAFVLLCGLAAVAFSADSPRRGPLRLVIWCLTFLPALLLLYPGDLLPDVFRSNAWLSHALPSNTLPHIGFEPTQIAMLLVIMTAVLLRYPIPLLSAAWSALLAAVWLATLLNAGTPAILAWLMAAGLPLLGVALSWRHTGFSTTAMREEARIIILLSALVMTIIPAVITGWQFQSEFQLTDATEYLIEADNAGFLLLLLATLIAGLLYRLLTRRKL